MHYITHICAHTLEHKRQVHVSVHGRATRARLPADTATANTHLLPSPFGLTLCPVWVFFVRCFEAPHSWRHL